MFKQCLLRLQMTLRSFKAELEGIRLKASQVPSLPLRASSHPTDSPAACDKYPRLSEGKELSAAACHTALTRNQPINFDCSPCLTATPKGRGLPSIGLTRLLPAGSSSQAVTHENAPSPPLKAPPTSSEGPRHGEP